MTIRYITEGDEFKARQLLGEARHQLSILKNLMGFQNLKQDQRLVRFNNGNVIQCISCFGQDVIKVFVPFGEKEKPHKKEVYEDIFRFRITRDDGVVIDHTMLTYILIYQPNTDDSTIYEYDYVGMAIGYHPDDDPEDAQYWAYDNGVWIYEKQEVGYVTKFRYNTETQIWTVPFYSPLTPIHQQKIKIWPRQDYIKSGLFEEGEEIPENRNFWAVFATEENSVPIMYKRPFSFAVTQPRYIYKESDWFQKEDKLVPKFYEVAVPYYMAGLLTNDKVHIAEPPVGMGVILDDTCYDWPEMPLYAGNYHLKTTLRFENTANKSMTYTMKVVSSLPYNVTFRAWRALGMYYYIERTLHCCSVTMERCSGCIGPALKVFFYDDVSTITTSEGYSGDAITKLNETVKITPTPYVVEERTHTVTITYGGPDSKEEIQYCTDGNLEFTGNFIRLYSSWPNIASNLSLT